MTDLVTIRPEDFDAYLAFMRSEGTRVVMPDDKLRAIVVDVLLLGKAFGVSPGWSRTDTTDGVSVTIPRMPSPLPELLTLAGVALKPLTALGAEGVKALADLASVNTVSFAPRVIAQKNVFVPFHERQHELQADDGGIIHDLRYLVAPEYRMLAAEGPAMVCDLAKSVWVDGDDPEQTATALSEGLRAYGADNTLVADARAQLMVHVRVMVQGYCPPVRSLVDGVRFLAARGVKNLPSLPAA